MPVYQHHHHPQHQRGGMMGYNNGYNRGGSGYNMTDRDNEVDPEQFHKLFIGGLSFETNENSLKNYFSKWGEIKDVVVMRDSQTKRSRGFGFIKYKSKDSIDEVQNNRPHKLDERDVETKRAMPKEADPYALVQRSVKKMFVGGMKDDTTEEQIRDAFKPYGEIEQIELINDKSTGKLKGFCFVTFSDYDPVDKLVLKKKMSLNNKTVEMKKAFAKGELDGGPGGRGMGMGMPMGGRGGRGDYGYGGYNAYYGAGFGGGYCPGGYGGYDYGNYGGPGGHHQGNQGGGKSRYSGNNYGQGNNYSNYNSRR